MIHPIRYYGDPVLRKVARPVEHFDETLNKLVSDMIETMHDANGVGLAATQIGIPKQIFVAQEIRSIDGDDPEDNQIEVMNEHVVINPSILCREGDQDNPEGCLSIPGIFVESIRRYANVRLRYQGLDGTWHELNANGHLAQVIQHEYDHLKGILFFDRLSGDSKQRFLEQYRSELADIQRTAKSFLKQLKRGTPSPSLDC
ncbi:MAG: peptide deformylase [Trueperaceae bacterium]|nr:MAG: peptide deformylase [Trueperaceae bacterium]